MEKLLKYKRNCMQHVNRMPRNRLPRLMKHYCPTGRGNCGRPLKRLLDTWDRNGSTSGPTAWQIYDDDEDDVEIVADHVIWRWLWRLHNYRSLKDITLLKDFRPANIMSKWVTKRYGCGVQNCTFLVSDRQPDLIPAYVVKETSVSVESDLLQYCQPQLDSSQHIISWM